MVLYFSNSLSSYIWKDTHLKLLFLKVLTYPIILANIKTNALISSFKYPIKYLKLFYVSINFEITTLSASTSQIFIDFFTPSNYYFATLVLPNLNIIMLSKIFAIIIFELIDTFF